MRSRKNRPVRLSRCVGAGFERVASVFERGGREPMGGSVGSAGEDLLVGLREVGSVGRIAGTTPEFNSDGPHTSGDGPDELKVP